MTTMFQQAADTTATRASAATIAFCRRFARAAAVGVFLVGVAVLVGWAFKLTALTQAWMHMTVNTALVLALGGLAMMRILLAHETPSRGGFRIAASAAALAALIGVLTLLEYAGLDFDGFDPWFSQPGHGSLATPLPGRMSLLAAACSVLTGIALLLVARRRRDFVGWAQGLASLVAIGMLFPLVGYFFGATSNEKFPFFSSTTLHTALPFLVLTLGIFCVDPTRGLMKLFTADSSGGQLLRRLLAPLVLLPVAINWLEHIGERRGRYPADLGETLASVSMILLVGLLVWNVARLVHRKDAARRAAEVNLERSEERYRKLIEQSPDGIVVKSRDRIEFINPVAAAMLGIERPEDAVGQSALGYLHPESRNRLDPLMCTLLEAGQTISPTEQKILRRDGAPLEVELAASPVDYHGRRVAQVVFRDLTARRRSEETIREQAALLDKAQDAIFVTDLEHRIHFWNRSAERLYGWSATDACGRHATALISKDSTALEGVQAELSRCGEWTGEMNHTTRDGRNLQVEARYTLVRDEQGQPKSILAINTDITEKKKIEAQFLRAQRVESIGTLAGGIAHDLNNILAPILLSIGLLRRPALEGDFEGILDTIETCAKRGAAMVKQVLLFARGVGGHPMSVPPRDLIGDVVRFIEETFPKSIRCKTDVAREVHSILGDPTQLHQVLLNLCVNARDAMPHGGTLIISAENVSIDEHYVKMSRQGRSGDHILIAVTDTGTGIPAEIRDRIFDPFFTTKEPGKGTGLGLATAMTIMRGHGGFIDVASEVGKGTTFRAYFPAATAVTARTESVLPFELPRGHGEGVLVVDDEAAVRSIVQQMLEAFGYRVFLAENGVAALSIYTQHRREIAVVLTDMMMPVMDGHQTVAALRNLNPQVRIIAASGLDASGSSDQETSASVKHFLSKPYSAESMLKELAAILEEPAAAAAADSTS